MGRNSVTSQIFRALSRSISLDARQQSSIPRAGDFCFLRSSSGSAHLGMGTELYCDVFSWGPRRCSSAGGVNGKELRASALSTQKYTCCDEIVTISARNFSAEIVEKQTIRTDCLEGKAHRLRSNFTVFLKVAPSTKPLWAKAILPSLSMM